MPRRLAPCTHPGCPTLTRNGRCPAHEQQADRSRGTANARGYNARWRRRRAAYLRTHPWCEHDEHQTHRIAATDVHHRDGQGPRGDNRDQNLQALCHAHHSAITARTTTWGKGRPDR